MYKVWCLPPITRFLTMYTAIHTETLYRAISKNDEHIYLQVSKF